MRIPNAATEYSKKIIENVRFSDVPGSPVVTARPAIITNTRTKMKTLFESERTFYLIFYARVRAHKTGEEILYDVYTYTNSDARTAIFQLSKRHLHKRKMFFFFPLQLGKE